MQVREILNPDSIVLDIDVSSGKQLFRQVAQVAAQHTSISERSILNALIERERLGSTAIGGGISIPHARFPELIQPVGYFIRPAQPIDMDSVDDKPIVIVFVLLAPDNADSEHLKLLGRIARIVRNDTNKDILKSARNPDDIMVILTSEDG